MVLQYGQALPIRMEGREREQEKKGRGRKRGAKEEDARETQGTSVETFPSLALKPNSQEDTLESVTQFPREALILYVLHPSLPQSYPLPLLAHQLGLYGGQNWCPSPRLRPNDQTGP